MKQYFWKQLAAMSIWILTMVAATAICALKGVENPFLSGSLIAVAVWALAECVIQPQYPSPSMNSLVTAFYSSRGIIGLLRTFIGASVSCGFYWVIHKWLGDGAIAVVNVILIAGTALSMASLHYVCKKSGQFELHAAV